MSLKVKLLSCISAFIIVASLMLISVFAATNVTLNIGGNVSFTASSVNAYITGSIAGNVAGGSTLTPIDIDASDSDGAVSMPSDWTAMDLTFTESASPITVTINIQNRSTDREITVSLTDSTNISNVTVTRECDGTGITASDSRNIPGEETITYTFELNVQSQNSSASGDFGLSVKLEKYEPVYYDVTISGVDFYAINGGELISVQQSQTVSVKADRVIIGFGMAEYFSANLDMEPNTMNNYSQSSGTSGPPMTISVKVNDVEVVSGSFGYDQAANGCIILLNITEPSTITVD